MTLAVCVSRAVTEVTLPRFEGIAGIRGMAAGAETERSTEGITLLEHVSFI